LVFTLGGVTEEPLSTRDLAGDRGNARQSARAGTRRKKPELSLSGGAAYSNNITIDGLDNNDDRGAPDFVFSLRSNQLPKFRLLPINFPPNTDALRAVASIFAPRGQQSLSRARFFFPRR
jgi:hypothetical protein